MRRRQPWMRPLWVQQRALRTSRGFASQLVHALSGGGHPPAASSPRVPCAGAPSCLQRRPNFCHLPHAFRLRWWQQSHASVSVSYYCGRCVFLSELQHRTVAGRLSSPTSPSSLRMLKGSCRPWRAGLRSPATAILSLRHRNSGRSTHSTKAALAHSAALDLSSSP